MARSIETKVYAREVALCLVAVAAIELVFYLYKSDDFSVFVYVTSVFEVFIAPLVPGWRLVYPPIALAIVLGLLGLLRRVKHGVVRVGSIFLLSLAWAVLGFVAIVDYYQ